MTAHLPSKGYLLTPALKEIRRTRTKRLLQWHVENGHENILFKDKKIFTIEDQYNNQYNKIYVQTSFEVRSEGTEMLSPFLRHGLVTPLHFCEKGVKTGARVCQEDVLQGDVKPFNTTLFNGQKCVFQQDSAPVPKAKTTQEWLRRHVPAFISAEDWPSGSPDLNSLDYKLWAVLEDMVCRKRHNNLDSLKRSLVKAAAEIPWKRCVPQ
jgi:hypothetical protein